jgi:uncharacterized membrane protein
MTDLRITHFLFVVFLIQIAVILTSIVGSLGLEVPIFGPIIGFVYLAFVPGLLLLRVLKLHNLGIVETLLYSLGLSISSLMLLGLALNFVGIPDPMSQTTLLLGSTCFVLVLSGLAYYRDRDFFPQKKTVADKEPASHSIFPTLLLVSILVLSFAGTFLENFFGVNTLLILLLFTISIIPVLAMFNRFPKRYFPIAIFVISLSFLYQGSLISQNLWGWDSNIEFYFANIVRTTFHWNWNIDSNVNSMLSVTMLAPIFSVFCNLNLTWVFKIVYPLLFSFVPLGLFKIFEKQTDQKVAFLSCFFFISLLSTSVSIEILQLARQQIAELFLVLILLLIVLPTIGGRTRVAMLILFSFSLVLSHYGLSYVYLLILIGALLIFKLKFPGIKQFELKNRYVNVAYFVLFADFLLFWYGFISQGSPLKTIIAVVQQIGDNLFNEFLNPQSTGGLGLIVNSSPPLIEVAKYFILLFLVFIVFGFSFQVLNRKCKFNAEFMALSFIGFLICLGGLIIPYFSNALNTSRLFQITLIFLAPFSVLGFQTLFDIIKRASKNKISFSHENVLKVFSVLLLVLFLLNSRVLFELSGQTQSSISLNSTFDFPRFSNAEVAGSGWLASNSGQSTLYGDSIGALLLAELALPRVQVFSGQTNAVNDSSFIFLRNLNVKGLITEQSTDPTQSYSFDSLQNSTFFNHVLVSKDKIYDNGYSEVYR